MGAKTSPFAPVRRRKAKPRAPARGQSPERSILELLDDNLDEYTVGDWRSRNLRLVDVLRDLDLFDTDIVPREAHSVLTESLIHVLNGAATDPQNAGHVRAQNENVLYYALAGGIPKRSLTIALEAGFIHDLNKAVGEPLRQDEYGVLDARGRRVPVMTTMAQIVGLNHLGDRTRVAITNATRLARGALDSTIARAIDLCIVHHGLGSSKFIQDLVDGRNPWWGSEFVDGENGQRKLVHPSQPELTLESVIHDLADSTQQMQGGAAWLMKYPAGFWRGSGRSLASMMSGRDQSPDDAIPLSLRLQIEVETTTCKEIVANAHACSIIDAELARRLEAAVEEATASSRLWIEDSPEYLADPNGESVYHDVGRSIGMSATEALGHLGGEATSGPDAESIYSVVWESGRRVDLDRARALAHRIRRTRVG